MPRSIKRSKGLAAPRPAHIGSLFYRTDPSLGDESSGGKGFFQKISGRYGSYSGQNRAAASFGQRRAFSSDSRMAARLHLCAEIGCESGCELEDGDPLAEIGVCSARPRLAVFLGRSSPGGPFVPQ